MHIKMERLGNLKNGRQMVTVVNAGELWRERAVVKSSCLQVEEYARELRKERAVVMSSLQMTLTLFPADPTLRWSEFQRVGMATEKSQFLCLFHLGYYR